MFPSVSKKKIPWQGLHGTYVRDTNIEIFVNAITDPWVFSVQLQLTLLSFSLDNYMFSKA